jgi:hypothetical protein
VTSDADYDRGNPHFMVTPALQGWGHGPIVMARRFPTPLVRGWCIECATWVGPDRTGDPNSLRLVEDDAIGHLHAVGSKCGLCEKCLPDGALA